MKKERKDILWRVGTAARHIIKVNRDVYGNDLLGLIPVKLLNKRLTDGTAIKVSEEIDKIRFEKEDELAKSLGLFGHPEEEKAKKEPRSDHKQSIKQTFRRTKREGSRDKVLVQCCGSDFAFITTTCRSQHLRQSNAGREVIPKKEKIIFAKIAK